MILVLFLACQSVARNVGGSSIVDVPCDQRIVSASWKESNVWYLTEPASADWSPRDLTYRESSNLGLLEGAVLFHERRCK